jgi:hypothetical protein
MMSVSRKIFIFCLESLFPFKIVEPLASWRMEFFCLFVCFFFFGFISNFVVTVSLNSCVRR